MGIVLVTDSSSDVRGEEINKLNLKVVPLKVNFGTKEYKDGVDLSVDEFYKLLETEKEFPKTSQPSPQDYVDIFEEAKENGDEVIVLTISSGLSGTYQSVLLAKDIAEYDKVYVIDSLSCLTSLRCLVMCAVKLRDQGKSAKEIVDEIEVLKHHVHIFSVVDTLEGFYRGGRLSKTLYTLGSLLNLKPFMVLSKDGKIITNGKSMGYMKAYNVAAEQNKKYPINKEYGLFYGYTMGEDKLNKFIEKSFKQFDLETYDVSRIGCVSGAHVGCGGCCMAYISTKERDEK